MQGTLPLLLNCFFTASALINLTPVRILLPCVFFFTLFVGRPGSLFAQKPNEKYQYHIFPAASDIRVDGIGSEAAWQNVDVAKDFFMVQPVDTSFSRA